MTIIFNIFNHIDETGRKGVVNLTTYRKSHLIISREREQRWQYFPCIRSVRFVVAIIVSVHYVPVNYDLALNMKKGLVAVTTLEESNYYHYH